MFWLNSKTGINIRGELLYDFMFIKLLTKKYYTIHNLNEKSNYHITIILKYLAFLCSITTTIC